MKSLRLGVIGIGNMGSVHCQSLIEGKVPGCELAAICDQKAAAGECFPGAKRFSSASELIRSGEVDAVLIATPHYSHTTIGIEALEAGLHVLVEKPLSVHKADCERLIAAHRDGNQVFAAMFSQRTDPYYRKVRELVRNGELGAIRRVNWIITDWFRTERYYATGGWRATWAGEGGGVLLNQCPHNLDLNQWIFGMLSKVRGFCQLGRYHAIEVEDDVTAYFEQADGSTAVFIASTGEAPGTNRLEIVGEQGKVVLEHNKLAYTRNEMRTTEFSRTTDSGFSTPGVWNVDTPLPDHRGEQHVGILKNFTNAVRDGETLLTPAEEGIHSVELGNAILMSSLLEETVAIPLTGERYEGMLKDLVTRSKFVKTTVEATHVPDFSKSL